MTHPPHKTVMGLTHRRLLLAVAIVGVIIAASLFGLQALTLVPKGLLPPLMVFLGVFMLWLVALGVRPDRRALAVLLLSAVALIALLGIQTGLLTVAELTHVACFGGLGLTLGPASPAYAIVALTIISAGDEALQALLPYRVGSLADVALNLVSALLFYAGWQLFGRGSQSAEKA